MNSVASSVHSAMAASPPQERAPGAIGAAAREAAHAQVMEKPGKALGVYKQSGIEPPTHGGKIDPPTGMAEASQQPEQPRDEPRGEPDGVSSLMQTFSRMSGVAG